jgi:muramidase (phage lysozyme)
MPASIQYIASRSNQPAFSILNRQLKANKLAPIPEAVYTAAQEAQNTVTGELQALLNQYPSPTRTDIAMIGSGQQAIYTQLQPTQRQGLDILAKYESGNLGYDAMNEAGTDGGRNAIGSGNAVTKLGKSFTQMTIAEVMGHQAAGRLHAAGRYQFIGPTLAEQVQKLGIPPTALFNQEMQDYMASEYAKQVGWRGIWIGPTDKATPQEAAVLDAMSAADAPGVPPWRQARNMNPSVVAMTVRTKEQGPGSGYWKWDVQRNLWVKSNADQ